MRVGVTGSSGLVGRELVGALREAGDEVVAFTRPSSRGEDAPRVRWDPARGEIDEGDLARVGGLDAVVHLAGAGIGDRRWNEARKKEILDSRVNSTALLAAAFVDAPSGPPYLACASAVGWYGSRGEEVLTEASSRGAGFLADVCEAWEGAAGPLESAGSGVAHLRTGIVLARHGGALRSQLPLFRWGLGGRLGDGRQWMSPVALEDEVRAISWILERRPRGPVNLVGPRPCTNRDFTRALARALGRPAPFAVPASALRVALGAEMADELVLTSQRVVPQVLTDVGFAFSHPTLEGMLTAALH